MASFAFEISSRRKTSLRRSQRGLKSESCEYSPMRVERLDNYFAKTGNIALSNNPKISQRPVLDDGHVLGTRAWPAGHLARRQGPGRGRGRGMRGREGWGERRALVRGEVNKREMTRTLRGGGGEKESRWWQRCQRGRVEVLVVEMSNWGFRTAVEQITRLPYHNVECSRTVPATGSHVEQTKTNKQT